MELSDLKSMTSKEVFNHVKNHLLTQGVRSLLAYRESKSVGCAYRDNGKQLKCAAGSLISDEEYDPSIEGNTWTTLVNSGKVPFEHSMLIDDLQKIHDVSSPNEWETELNFLEEKINSGYYEKSH